MGGGGVRVAGIALHGDGHGGGALLLAVGAAADFGELLLQGAQGDAVLRALGACHGGHDGGEVELELHAVIQLALAGHAEEALGAEVVFAGGHLFLAAAGGAQVGGAHFIEGEEAHGGAVFRGHVGHGGAVRQG